MNAKRLTSGAVVVRMTTDEANNFVGVGSSIRGNAFESALRKLRAAILNIDGDTIDREDARLNQKWEAERKARRLADEQEFAATLAEFHGTIATEETTE